MLYSQLGTSGLVVSRLSLGTMTFTAGGGNAAIATTDRAAADRLLGKATRPAKTYPHFVAAAGDAMVTDALAARPGDHTSPIRTRLSVRLEPDHVCAFVTPAPSTPPAASLGTGLCRGPPCRTPPIVNYAARRMPGQARHGDSARSGRP